MKILTYSRAFLPHVGGLEYSVHNLSSAWSRLGHAVAVVTTTPGDGPDDMPYCVIRCPGPGRLLDLVRWCDVFHQANVSLRGWWPLLLVHRPWVVSHHSWYERADGRKAWQDRLKRLIVRRASASIAVSRVLAAGLPTPTTVIENAYRNDLFTVLPTVPRDHDLLFVGRLVPDKGVDLLLEALVRLASIGLRPRLTIAGVGPYRAALEQQAASLGMGERVVFVGSITGEPLVELMNQHRILVVPSRLNEPFGIVALEGIACGCAVIGSSGGGLAGAIGPCGETFPNGDVGALTAALERLLADDSLRDRLQAQAPEHLARHRADVVAARYLEVFEAALRRSPC